MLNIRTQVWNENISIWDEYIPEKKSVKYFYQPLNYENLNCTTQKPLIQILKSDTLDSALKLQKLGYNPLILNMADIYHPGGCVAAGGGMQEESLFRRSNYHRHLLKELYPIEIDAAIYSPNVCIFRDNEENNFINIGLNHLSFIACPALSMPQLDRDDNFTKNDEQIFRNKIRLIFQVANENNHDSLILGAWGCGAFGCPVRHVAKIFYDEIQNCKYDFNTIIFAIHGKNYAIFKDYFN